MNSEAVPADRERDAAFADALDEGARVLMRLSGRLRALHVGEQAADRAAAPPGPAPVDIRRAQPLGERQMAVLDLSGLGAELGLAASEVAQALEYTPSNATNILKRLEELNYLVRVRDERPVRWRRATPADG
ncbi:MULTISPECIES: MarR family transcriptional regulator [unclassified Modestobacter]|uniref:MarR family transcriptional regulator n=1 Tax=unclassified Modestobacter TaxID=2643866 RepID=UPI0022AABEC7|nr:MULTISPECIES: MarR family transcriptional regulator [unclassified Modestobacter]MCZ2826024.1 hypothetical protein [Modestobacter sp. VKM Ac-2981]MCZ2852911.1 hypothetical protein [Modestobacter sp. VKM Ac-2982]